MKQHLLINTPLKWRVGDAKEARNRFNGFDRAWKTVETVFKSSHRRYTLLKQGVNENRLTFAACFVKDSG